MKTKKILGVSEFLIVQYTNDHCQIRESERRYIPMFKYKKEKKKNEHWCFSVPIQPMYLLTLADAKKNILNSIESDKEYGWTAEYRIAEIKNS